MIGLRCALADPMLVLWALIVMAVLVVGSFCAGASWSSSDHNPDRWP